MTSFKFCTPADVVQVAIDIAKMRNEVLIEAPGHKRRRRLSVLNNRAEHDRLIGVLQAYGRPVICAFEATRELSPGRLHGAWPKPVSRCGWYRRWHSPERGRPCTTAGTRMIPRMRR